jgi:hypothetical protein
MLNSMLKKKNKKEKNQEEEDAFGQEFHKEKSILMYGAEIWGWKEQEEVEKVQEKYLGGC